MNIGVLFNDKIILFDGATGTEYQKYGLPIGAAPEIFILEKPEIVKQIHEEYISAGAQVIETNTFGANRIRLESVSLHNRVAEVNKRAAEIALSTVNDKVLVAGSIGPLGKLIEPYGEISVDYAREVFNEQIQSLVQSGVDFILIETMISLNEALIALEAAKHSDAKIVGVTMTFDQTPSGPRTSFGESPKNCTQILIDHGADIIGSNCGSGFDVMREVANEMIAVSNVSVLIQPNAGIPAIVEGKIRYPETPERFAKFVKDITALGINLVGGCCGTTPEHIRSAKQVLFKR